MNVQAIPLPDLATALRPHGVTMSYGQLFARAASGVFPIRRENRLVYAIGDPEDIAKLIQHEEQKKSRKAA
ncbi:MAG: hypothetical protein KDA62_16250 [Planctomycetales bacterium]|nr:hypothetical protein [Planctomycetales bacterium]